MNHCSITLRRLWAFMIAGLCIQTAGAADWKPVDPALLANAVPVVEKDADVEGIFWEMWVSPNGSKRNAEIEVKHHIQLKIFTDRGLENVKQVDLTIPAGTDIKDIEGRTIKPDGTIVELSRDSIFEKKLASIGNYEVKSKSFAFPAAEAGAIVEYRWKMHMPFSTYTRYHLQGEVPMRAISFHIKPAPAVGGMNSICFNMPNMQLQKEANGYYGLQLANVSSFKREPLMPPHDSIRAFLLVFYRSITQPNAVKYWDDYGKMRYNGNTRGMNPNDEVRRKTSEVVGNSTQGEEAIGKIFHFVRSNIINIDDDASGVTREQREAMKDNKNPSDTLNRGSGTSGDILWLFGSMAIAAGFDVRMPVTGDRSDFFFTPPLADTYFLRSYFAAIKVNDEWRFYDPVARYLPLGMLPWVAEGNSALMPDPNEPQFVSVPLSPPEKSRESRKAALKLSEDGTLEGDVSIEYTGHLGAWKKEDNDAESPAKREEDLKEMIKKRLSNADVTQIQIENVTDPDKPFTYRFHVRIPNYGQRTGKRLFFQPEFFQKGIDPLFTASQRKHSVYFNYPWSEVDEIEIRLPEGFALESLGGRQPLDIGDAGKYQLEIKVSEDRRVLRCLRNFAFGDNNNILIAASKYPLLKQLFDTIHELDNHTLTLAQETAP